VLVDGDAIIFESAIINEYLDEKFPSLSLMPADLYARARVRIWVDFCNTRIHGATHEISRGKDPESAKAKLKQHFLTVDEALAGRDFLIGNYSLADVTFIPVFTRLSRYGFSLDDDLPRVKTWSERLLNRPAVQTTLVRP
jgi:glutathione S-transferase